MEYKHFMRQLFEYMPSNNLRRNPNFFGWFNEIADSRLEQLSDFFVGTIPGKRTDKYRHSDFAKV